MKATQEKLQQNGAFPVLLFFSFIF